MKWWSGIGGEDVSRFQKLATALFYAISSVLIVVINKMVLTSHKFPSFQMLGIGQMVASLLVLSCSKTFGIVSFPDICMDTFGKIFPLPLIYFGNLVFGLGGTQSLNLPMYTVLRRFSILMTMIGEYFILKCVIKRTASLSKSASFKVQASVYLMIIGSVIAASTDLAFSSYGYTMIMLNNLMTAGNGVYVKKKLDAKDLGKYGLLFYNSLFMIIPAVLFAWYNGEIEKVQEFSGWSDPLFLLQFLLSCVMGFILNYAVVLCTQANSALTTTIVGCLKNILVTYCGMLIDGDYVFSWPNFIGLNISIFGSILYSYVAFYDKKPSPLLPISNPKNWHPSYSSPLVPDGLDEIIQWLHETLIENFFTEMKCTVRFKLYEVTCPGVLHLGDRSPVFISIYLFGRVQASNEVYPSFPMIFDSKIKFQRHFLNAKTPDHVIEILEDETIAIELRQHVYGLKNGKVIAQYEESSRKFLFPDPSFRPKPDPLKQEIFLIRTEDFTTSSKALNPQLVFITKTSIKESPDDFASTPYASTRRQYKSPSFPESFIPTDRFSKISETKNRSRMGHLSDIHCNSNTRQVSDSHRSTTDTTEKAGNNSSKIRPNKTSNTSKSRSRKKRHCVCECPNVVDKTTEIQKLLKDSKENSNKKVKPFRTGLEPENLISKRDFEEQDRVTIIKKAKGFCPHCAVPSPKCVLCTGYKGVYGNDFLIHRFANSKTNPKNSVNNHVQTVKEKSRKSNQDAIFQKVDHSPVSITVHDNVLSESSPEEEKSFIKNDKSFRTSTQFKTKTNPHLKPKYSVSRALPKNLHSYKLHESSSEDLSSDERRPSYSPVLPSRGAMYEYLENENEIEEHYRLASEFPLTYADNRLVKSGYPFSYSAPTRAARSKLFNRSRHYISVRAKEKDNFDEESERIQQRIKDLMKKNNSKLVYELSTESSDSDSVEVEPESLSFNEPPISTSSKIVRRKKNAPMKSFVAPLGGDQKLLGRERGMERRRNLDASLNAIYKDLYERTLKSS